MKLLAAILLTSISLAAGQRVPVGWFACDTAGKTVPVVQADVVDLPVPIYQVSRPGAVAFLTKSGAFNLAGRTLVATFWFATTGDPTYLTPYPGFSTIPCNMRLYFSTQVGNYSLNYGMKHPTADWWSHDGWIYMVDADNGQLVTLTASLDSVNWSDAMGGSATDNLAAFQQAAANAHTVGFAFGGGSFFDTGVNVHAGTAVMHLVSFEIQ